MQDAMSGPKEDVEDHHVHAIWDGSTTLLLGLL